MTTTEEGGEFRKCAGCHAERVCRWYGEREVWLCTSGPVKCWRHRKTVKLPS